MCIVFVDTAALASTAHCAVDVELRQDQPAACAVSRVVWQQSITSIIVYSQNRSSHPVWQPSFICMGYSQSRTYYVLWLLRLGSYSGGVSHCCQAD